MRRSGVKAPKILKLGKLEGGTEWLFMEHKEGEVFAKVKDVMSEDNIKDFSRLFRKNVDAVLKELFDQHLKEESLQRQCAEILKGKFNLVEDVKAS